MLRGDVDVALVLNSVVVNCINSSVSSDDCFIYSNIDIASRVSSSIGIESIEFSIRSFLASRVVLVHLSATLDIG